MSDRNGKTLLLEHLHRRQNEVWLQLDQANSDILLWQAAVDLWTELGEVEEQGDAAAMLAACSEKVPILSAAHQRIGRAISHLDAVASIAPKKPPKQIAVEDLH